MTHSTWYININYDIAKIIKNKLIIAHRSMNRKGLLSTQRDTGEG